MGGGGGGGGRGGRGGGKRSSVAHWSRREYEPPLPRPTHPRKYILDVKGRKREKITPHPLMEKRTTSHNHYSPRA